MANNRIVFQGLDQLRAELRNLPAELTGEATSIVMDTAIQTKETVGAVYAKHRHTGNLLHDLTLHVEEIGPFGTSAEVRSRAFHAWLFEKGSQARHYFTVNGKRVDTGEMWGKTSNPPTHIVARTASRMRRLMNQKLRALVERKGLTVTGTDE